jgi:ABC-type branched-subunit amino acid transport system substrate-binding protein
MNGPSAGFLSSASVITAWAALLLSSDSSGQIVIAHLSTFTGSIAARINENHQGAEAYIKKINAAGGVNGELIELRKVDDGGKWDTTTELAKGLVKDKKVVAFFMPGATPATNNIGKVADPIKFPVVAPSNGAAINISPLRPSIFNLRASYQVEAQNTVLFLHKLGYSRFAVVYVDDVFGKDALLGATRGFEKLNLKPLMQMSFPRDNPDLNPVINRLVEVDADVVLSFAPGPNTADVFKGAKQKNVKLVLASLSNNSSAAFIKMLGDKSRGAFVSQVVPSESSTLPVIAEMAAVFPGGREKMSPSQIEGYLGAKVLVEAVRRAGKNPTPAKVHAALEDMKEYDLGGLKVGYSSNDHTGLDFTELSIVSRLGVFLR